jgi:hypothetical protein
MPSKEELKMYGIVPMERMGGKERVGVLLEWMGRSQSIGLDKNLRIPASSRPKEWPPYSSILSPASFCFAALRPTALGFAGALGVGFTVFRSSR